MKALRFVTQAGLNRLPETSFIQDIIKWNYPNISTNFVLKQFSQKNPKNKTKEKWNQPQIVVKDFRQFDIMWQKVLHYWNWIKWFCAEAEGKKERKNERNKNDLSASHFPIFECIVLPNKHCKYDEFKDLKPLVCRCYILAFVISFVLSFVRFLHIVTTYRCRGVHHPYFLSKWWKNEKKLLGFVWDL